MTNLIKRKRNEGRGDQTVERGGGRELEVVKNDAAFGVWKSEEMECRVLVPGRDPWVRGQIGGGLSHESEHDLALMVSDFLENGSCGAESWCSSDSESSLSDLSHLAEKIPVSSLLIIF